MKHSDEIKNVAKKITMAMADMSSHAQKDGQNKHFRYKYTSISQYISHVRPALVKHSLVIIPGLIKREDHSDGLTDVVMEYNIIDSDSGEYITTSFEGRGQDKQDKGTYKAYSGAFKYFLQQMFLIASGAAEAEQDQPGARPEKKPAPPEKKEPPPKNKSDYIARILFLKKEILDTGHKPLTDISNIMDQLSIGELTTIGLNLKDELEQLNRALIEDIQCLSQEINTAGGNFDVPLLLERNTHQELHTILVNMQTRLDTLDF